MKIMKGDDDMQYSELQQKGFEIAEKYTRLPLDERLCIIAQAFGVKSASIFVQPCTGKYRGQSGIMIKLEGGGSMGIGMCGNASAQKSDTISECVNNVLAKCNPEIVAETKARAAIALKARESEDNKNAEQRGLKPYKLLNVELSPGIEIGGHTGWYYAAIAVDNKIIGFVTSDLASDIERGVLTNSVSRTDYFVAGGVKDEEVDFVFNNVGHSSVGDLYTVKMSQEALERAEKALVELSSLNRESDLLYGAGNLFGIYQIRVDTDETRNLRFVSMRELEKLGSAPKRSNYELVYTAPFTERVEFLSDRYCVLDRVFRDFNIDKPLDYTGRSVSVSDVIVLNCNGNISVHYVDSFGFIEIDGFFGETKTK